MESNTIKKPSKNERPLIDSMGRVISYLRLSVTDRCDFRCQYCMDEKVKFLPKADVLTLEELYLVAKTFMRCGINRIRLTGGEPLIRRDIQRLVKILGSHVASGDLEELTLTTNGSQLAFEAENLWANHVKRINVSLDTLDPDKFSFITRRGKLDQVLNGINIAKDVGLDIKINMVVMGQENSDDVMPMLDYSIQNGFDLTLIEAMPLKADNSNRIANYKPLSHIVEDIQPHYALVDTTHKTAGPARYKKIQGSSTRLGLITPLSNNFCAGCNRIRLTCTGQLYPCLGHDTHLDFREQIRSGATEDDLIQMLHAIIQQKPDAHNFSISKSGYTSDTKRSMNTTGG